MSVCECETVYAYSNSSGVGSLQQEAGDTSGVLMFMRVTFLRSLPHREEALRLRTVSYH